MSAGALSLNPPTLLERAHDRESSTILGGFRLSQQPTSIASAIIVLR